MSMSALSTPSAISRSQSRRPISFANTLASEWMKTFALRSTYLTLALGFGLSVATTAIACFALGSTRDEWAPDFNPVTTSMVGTIFSLIVYSAFGVMVASREYASGSIRLTLIASPNRTRVFLAKLALVTGTITVFGVLTSLAMFYAGQVLMSAYGMPTAAITDDGAARMVLGLGVATAFFPVLGFAFGVLTRSTAGGITTVLGLLWLPQIFGQLVPMWFRENILNLLPSNGIDSLTVSHIQPSPSFSSEPVGALIVFAWLAAVIGSAYVAMRTRDA